MRDHQAEAMGTSDLEAKKRYIAKARTKMRATLRIRLENDVESLCLNKPRETSLYNMLSTKQLYVAGRDRQGRPTLVYVPGRVESHDLILTRQAHMWCLEKAIACSRAAAGTFNAVIDFCDFDCVRDAPPLAVGRDILSLLRDQYVGRLHRIYFVNATLSIRGLWSIFSPFAGTKTKRKIEFVKNKVQVFEPMFEPDQAPSWMMPSGKWNDCFDMDTFLSLPFDQLLHD